MGPHCAGALPDAPETESLTGELGLQSRIYNLRETKVIRDLNPADINKLISVSGMVTRTSGVIPDQRCFARAGQARHFEGDGREASKRVQPGYG